LPAAHWRLGSQQSTDTQNINFTSLFSHPLRELIKAKSWKEMQIAELKVFVREAQAGLEKSEQSLADLARR
jgi:hypothetical protein